MVKLTQKTFLDKKRILVTSALPYANGPIHIGHLVEYVQTDIFVRFLRLIGKDVIYCCADDAHGTPIELKARELGVSPEELIEQVFKEHTEDFAKFGVSFDNYYTTNSEENRQFSEHIFLKLQEKGLIYTKVVENFYDEKAQRFLPDRYVKGECPKCDAKDQYGDVCEKCNATYKPTDLVNPYSVLTKTAPKRVESKHYFFKLSEVAGKLDSWLSENKDLQPEVVNYVRNWIKDGLEDWDISRDGPYFGFKIPGEENKYFYVWLDAPIGYIASSDNFCKKHGRDAVSEYWKNEDAAIIHFIGKDITYFHFLFWPAMLLESEFRAPDFLVVHGFLTVNGEKMSKSRGTFLTAREFAESFNPEFLRFYFAHHLSRRLADIDLDFSHFVERVNNELVANLANFCYRVISFTNKHCDGKFGEIDEDRDVIESVTEKVAKIHDLYADNNVSEALKEILSIGGIGNKYFQDNEPWKLVKEDRERAQRVLGTCANIARNLSILISPILPSIAESLQKQLNVSDVSWQDIGFGLRDHTLGKEELLVQKIDEKDVPSFGEDGKKEEKAEEVEEGDDVFALNLRVAQIESVEDHPNADKLFVLQLDVGSEKRQLVAGLKGHYEKDALVGKKIVMITNLKYAKLRGVESQGMLLAGDDGEHVRALMVETSEPGTQVCFGDLKPSSKEITFDTFGKIEMLVKEGRIYFGELELRAGSEVVQIADVSDGARVR